MFYGTYKLMMDRYNLPASPTNTRDSDRPAVADSAGRRRARQALLRLSDHLLADCGISRDLLNQGVKAWPWRVEPETTSEPAGFKSAIDLDAHRPNVMAIQHQVMVEQRHAA